MTGRRRPLLLLAAVLTLAGCATLGGGAEPPGVTAAPPKPPAPPPPPPPPPPSPRQLMAAPHRAKAEAHEREGALRAALEAAKIALTLDPGDADTRALRSRLEARIEREVAERVQQGRAALAQGAHLDARRHFLAALALDPGHRTAFEALRDDVKDVRFVMHTVKPGETLGSIALRYYGDRSRSEVIWEINQLPRNPRLVAGTSLRVPEIPGLPFLPAVPREAPPLELPRGAPPREDVAPEADPLLVEVKEALERKAYADALVDVDRLLASNPAHGEGRELKKSILYSLGKEHFDQKQYDESYKTLTQLARLAPNYENAAELLRQSRTRLVQHHYREGLRFYREEKLERAIEEWRAVLEIDPRHASARKGIEQAEHILKRLEQLRKR